MPKKTAQTKVQNRPDSELRKMAVDMYHNRIFTDRHIPEHSQDLIGSIFMPLLFLKEDEREFLKDVGMIYAPMSEAGPRCINGFPMFTSMGYLNQHDTQIVLQYLREYRIVVERFTGEETKDPIMTEADENVL
jgi:hypothetical protein